jgi:nucleoside-diphosphate-sugar epimerase
MMDRRWPGPQARIAGDAHTDVAGLRHSEASRGVEVGPRRSYDVSTFIGDPARAEQILGWRASIGIEEGIYRLVECFRDGYSSPAEGRTVVGRL